MNALKSKLIIDHSFVGVGYGCQFLGNNAQWRVCSSGTTCIGPHKLTGDLNLLFQIPLAIQIIPAIGLLLSVRYRYHDRSKCSCQPLCLLFSGMFVLPYSPRWLAKQGRHEEARATLFRLHGGRKNAREDIVQSEFDEMLDQIRWGRCNAHWQSRRRRRLADTCRSFAANQRRRTLSPATRISSAAAPTSIEPCVDA